MGRYRTVQVSHMVQDGDMWVTGIKGLAKFHGWGLDSDSDDGSYKVGSCSVAIVEWPDGR